MSDELKPVGFGLTTAIIWGLYVFSLGVLATYCNWGNRAQSVIGSIYPGYGRSLPGIVIGTLWAVCDGFFGGLAFAWVYNVLSDKRCYIRRPVR